MPYNSRQIRTLNIITRKSIFFSLLFSCKIQNWYYTTSEFLCSLQINFFIEILLYSSTI